MIKNVQLKIILIFSILGIILIGGIGIAFIYNLQNIDLGILAQNEEELVKYQELMATQVHNIKLITIILISVYGFISILIGIFVAKVILDPIAKLIDSAPKIAAGENLGLENSKKTNVDDLTGAFNFMTNELRENLKEVNRQKRQIETILLHMTDGIIAFDIEGNIMHINPAATELLNLTENENTFDKIFNKLNIDINLEKTLQSM